VPYRFDFSFRTLGWGAGLLLLQQQQQRKGTDNRWHRRKRCIPKTSSLWWSCGIEILVRLFNSIEGYLWLL